MAARALRCDNLYSRFRGRSFLTVSYRATALTKALVKVINDDEIARGRGEEERKGEGRDTTANAITGGFINCHRRVICSAMRAWRDGPAPRTWSIAFAYLIAAFIKTVMSRSFNETRSMPPRDCCLASVIYGSGATISTLSLRARTSKLYEESFFPFQFQRFL